MSTPSLLVSVSVRSPDHSAHVAHETQPADYASAIAIELRRGSPPDVRDFLRFRYKNGTTDSWHDIHVFGHRSDVPLTEFIYRAEVRYFPSFPILVYSPSHPF